MYYKFSLGRIYPIPTCQTKHQGIAHLFVNVLLFTCVTAFCCLLNHLSASCCLFISPCLVIGLCVRTLLFAYALESCCLLLCLRRDGSFTQVCGPGVGLGFRVIL